MVKNVKLMISHLGTPLFVSKFQIPLLEIFGKSDLPLGSDCGVIMFNQAFRKRDFARYAV